MLKSTHAAESFDTSPTTRLLFTPYAPSIPVTSLLNIPKPYFILILDDAEFSISTGFNPVLSPPYTNGPFPPFVLIEINLLNLFSIVIPEFQIVPPVVSPPLLPIAVLLLPVSTAIKNGNSCVCQSTPCEIG